MRVRGTQVGVWAAWAAEINQQMQRAVREDRSPGRRCTIRHSGGRAVCVESLTTAGLRLGSLRKSPSHCLRGTCPSRWGTGLLPDLDMTGLEEGLRTLASLPCGLQLPRDHPGAMGLSRWAQHSHSQAWVAPALGGSPEICFNPAGPRKGALAALQPQPWSPADVVRPVALASPR